MTSNPEHKSRAESLLRDGWIPLKQWKCELAELSGVKLSAFNSRLTRGIIPRPKEIQVNKRVIFVKR